MPDDLTPSGNKRPIPRPDPTVLRNMDGGVKETVSTPPPQRTPQTGGVRETIFSHRPGKNYQVDTSHVRELWEKSLRPDITTGMTIRRDHRPSRTYSNLIVRQLSVKPIGTSHPPPHYELIRPIGSGGMGVVHEARQSSCDRTVALKVMRQEEDVEDAEDNRNKFLAEAAVTADLEHPNIVPVYEVGVDEQDTLFYSMKRVTGKLWTEELPRNSLRRNLEILMRVADAIAFAHSRAVIHRDIKPENVMIGDYGEVLVMDWGMAAAVPIKGPNGKTIRSKADAISATAAVGGTPAYIAPEMAIAEFEAIGVHSDVYLLGAILYEIVTGHPPHTGETVMDCLINAAHNIIAPTKQTGELVNIALKSMATNPKDRFASVADFQAAIRAYETHLESVSLSARARQDLQRATFNKSYRDYAQAVAGFRKAIEIWSGNLRAQKGLSEASLAYAQTAFSKDDLDLAQSLLESDDPSHTELADQILFAQKRRRSRKRRIKRLTRTTAVMAAALIIILTIAMFMVQRERTLAFHQRESALQSRQEAEYEAYLARIALAHAKADDEAFGEVKKLLARTPSHLRNWEWGWLQSMSESALTSFDGSAGVHISENGQVLLLVAQDGTGTIITPLTGQPLHELVQVPPDLEPQQVIVHKDWLITTSPDSHDILVWNLGSDSAPRRITGHTEPLHVLHLRPDSKQLLSASADNTTRLWDLITLTEKKRFGGHLSRVNDLDISPDGKQLLTVGLDGYAKVWDLQSGRIRMSVKGFNMAHHGQFSPDGKTIAIASRSSDLKGERATHLYEVSSGKLRRKLTHHTGVYAIQFAPRGRLIATGEWKGTIHLWDAGSGRKRHSLEGHRGAVHTLRFSSDGRKLVSCAEDHSARVWNVRNGKGGILGGHTSRMRFAAFSPDNRNILTTSDDLTGKVWLTARISQPFHEYSAKRVEWSADGNRVFLFDDEEFAAIDSLSGTRILEGRVPGVAYPSQDGTHLISIHDQTCQVFRLLPKRIHFLQQFKIKGTTPLIAALSPQNRRIAIGCEDGSIRIFGLRKGVELKKLDAGFASFKELSFSDDSRKLMARGSMPREEENTGRRERNYVWTLRDGQDMIADRREHRVAVSPGGRHLVEMASDHLVVRTVNDGPSPLPIPLSSAPQAIRFSPEGSAFAVALSNHSIQIWSLTQRQRFSRLAGHQAQITDMVFSRDRKRLLSASLDRTVRLWDPSNGRQILQLTHNLPVSRIHISEENPLILTKVLSPSAAHVRIYRAEPWE